jgi:hypothetical protein
LETTEGMKQTVQKIVQEPLKLEINLVTCNLNSITTFIDVKSWSDFLASAHLWWRRNLPVLWDEKLVSPLYRSLCLSISVKVDIQHTTVPNFIYLLRTPRLSKHDTASTSLQTFVGISHKAVLLREPAKPALFRATTNILSSDRRLANQRGDQQRRSPFGRSWLAGRV